MILCANSAPALNDVMYTEMVILLKKISAICPVIENAVTCGKLIVMENAQSGPCLDLRQVWHLLVDRLYRGKVLIDLLYSIYIQSKESWKLPPHSLKMLNKGMKNKND